MVPCHTEVFHFMWLSGSVSLPHLWLLGFVSYSESKNLICLFCPQTNGKVPPTPHVVTDVLSAQTLSPILSTNVLLSSVQIHKSIFSFLLLVLYFKSSAFFGYILTSVKARFLFFLFKIFSVLFFSVGTDSLARFPERPSSWPWTNAQVKVWSSADTIFFKWRNLVILMIVWDLALEIEGRKITIVPGLLFVSSLACCWAPS